MKPVYRCLEGRCLAVIKMSNCLFNIRSLLYFKPTLIFQTPFAKEQNLAKMIHLNFCKEVDKQKSLVIRWSHLLCMATLSQDFTCSKFAPSWRRFLEITPVWQWNVGHPTGKCYVLAVILFLRKERISVCFIWHPLRGCCMPHLLL